MKQKTRVTSFDFRACSTLSTRVCKSVNIERVAFIILAGLDFEIVTVAVYVFGLSEPPSIIS